MCLYIIHTNYIYILSLQAALALQCWSEEAVILYLCPVQQLLKWTNNSTAGSLKKKQTTKERKIEKEENWFPKTKQTKKERKRTNIIGSLKRKKKGTKKIKKNFFFQNLTVKKNVLKCCLAVNIMGKIQHWVMYLLKLVIGLVKVKLLFSPS